MSNFKGDYLRVLSPITTDGINVVIGPDGKMVYKEDHLPVTARKILEKKNLKLPQNLRKKIELVPAYQPPVRTESNQEPVKQKVKK